MWVWILKRVGMWGAWGAMDAGRMYKVFIGGERFPLDKCMIIWSFYWKRGGFTPPPRQLYNTDGCRSIPTGLGKGLKACVEC
jgi:hypothetical protein